LFISVLGIQFLPSSTPVRALFAFGGVTHLKTRRHSFILSHERNLSLQQETKLECSSSQQENKIAYTLPT